MTEEMKIVHVAVKDLRPVDYNPRYWSPKARDEIIASIKRFGFVQPLVVNSAKNRKNIVIGGNFKLNIAKELGIETVPVYYVDIPDIAKEKELNLRLNKNQAEFDFDMLKEFEESLLKHVGFDSKDLDKIFDDKDDDDFDAEEVAAGIEIPDSKPGEIYQLGKHRVMCGDSTKREDVEKLMGGGIADMVFTDPPYNVDYSGRGKKTSTKIEGDNQKQEDFIEFLTLAFRNFLLFTTDRAALYTCYASRTHREFEDALNEAGYEVRNQIIWVKLVASMGWGDYRWKHEPILYCHKNGQSIDFYGDRSEYTEWTEEMSDADLLKMIKKNIKKEEAGGSTVWRLHRDNKYDHPTQKPLKLCQIAIRNSSKRDELVLDLFGGSGSTLIAAEKLGRRSCLMELDPRYVDVILKRWEEFTGTKGLKIN